MTHKIANLRKKIAETRRLRRMVVFDTETTGLNPETDELLQISICDGTGKKLLNTYVRPTRHTEWPKAESINHISPKTVANAPTVDQLRWKIQKIFDRAELLITYNGKFDIRFLQAAGINPWSGTKDMVDVMLEFAPIFGEYNSHFGTYRWQKLTTAANFYGYKWPEHDAHDSMGDVLATLFVYDEMRKRK